MYLRKLWLLYFSVTSETVTSQAVLLVATICAASGLRVCRGAVMLSVLIVAGYRTSAASRRYPRSLWLWAHPHQQRAFCLEAACPLLPGFVMLYLCQLRISVFLPRNHLGSGLWRKVTLNWRRQRKMVFLSDVSSGEKKKEKSWTETRSQFSLNLKSLARECLKDKWELSKEGGRRSRGLAWERTAGTEKCSLQWDFLGHPLCRFYG